MKNASQWPQGQASRQAVALRYQPHEDHAPKVSAKGRGLIADRILALAREHNIPIREDKNLLQVLSRLDLEQEVPTHVYQAVAEILAFVYRVSKKRQATQADTR